ncbi:MAG: zinc ribbon domain-containing protein [Pseudomonadota bacterium]
MPIYEFRCDGCGQVFEHLALSQKEQKQASCPECGGKDLSRVMSACASVVESSSAGGGTASPQVQSRSCANAGNCATLTLPGHER